MTMTRERLPVCSVWVGHVHLWILLCLNVSSPKSHCHPIAPLSTLAFLHRDTGDSPTRPSMLELFLSLQDGTLLRVFFIFKGAGHNSLNLPLVPESVTDSHTLLLALYFSHTWHCYYTGKEVRRREYRDRKYSEKAVLRATLSTGPQSSTTHRNRGMSLANQSVFVGLLLNGLTVLKHLCVATGLIYSLCWAYLHTMWPNGTSIVGWLHLFIYTDRGVDWLSSWYWGLDQRGDAVF